MTTATSTAAAGSGREPLSRRAGTRLLAALALASVITGCAGGGTIPWPYPGGPETRPAPPPATRPPASDSPLATLPQDDEGLGRGPLGRTGVLLDRAIAQAERAERTGETIGASLIAHLRMTRSARDLIATGDTERALDLLERAIAIDDGAGFGYLYLGYLHLQGGRPEQAHVFFDRARALAPADPALHSEIDGLRSRAGDAAQPVAETW